MRLLLPCLTLLTAAVLVSCGDSGDTEQDAKPATIDVSGELRLMDASGVNDIWDENYHETGECEGVDGYSDINTGAQVTVYDASGEALALGTLEKGLMTVEGKVVPCVFTFKVPEVPIDGNVFSIEVSHRGMVNFTEEQLTDHVVLTLGESA